MPSTLFFRLLDAEDKGTALQQAISALPQKPMPEAFSVSSEAFEQVPGSPFSYWVSDKLRRLFSEKDQFEAEARVTCIGLTTSDDFRFSRSWWELNPSDLGMQDKASESHLKGWVPLKKTGVTSEFYYDISAVINWVQNGLEIKTFLNQIYAHWSRSIRNESFYFKPGITWPLRSSKFCPQALPQNCIFTARSHTAFIPSEQLLPALGILSSSSFDALFKMSLGRFGFPEFISGQMGRVPYPSPEELDDYDDKLSTLARRAWSLKPHWVTTCLQPLFHQG